MSLFAESEKKSFERAKPLAARMRPTTLDEIVGQQHLLGPDKLLRKMIDSERLGSIILSGPPGTGKTTLAEILANATQRRFQKLSAIEHGVKDVREVLLRARDDVAAGEPGALLFVDEIHRFNKSQQDALLGDVENGVVALVGATTSNPFFAVNHALVSRSQIFQLEALSIDDLIVLMKRAISDRRGLADWDIDADEEALEFLATRSDGDARRALNALEIAVLSSQQPVHLTIESVRNAIAHRAIEYDPTGDSHYDCASALIKSIRGSDPDAGIYWLARMLAGGEDIRFLCRRLVILASEDIGNADPNALNLAVSCFTACEQVGLPESEFMLAQTVTYLACAPKSNASTRAIGLAKKDIEDGEILPVPRHLRDNHYSGATEFGHGDGYQYSHQEADGVAAQDYLGVDRQYYEPVDRGFESELRIRLQRIREKLLLAKPSTDRHD